MFVTWPLASASAAGNMAAAIRRYFIHQAQRRPQHPPAHVHRTHTSRSFPPCSRLRLIDKVSPLHRRSRQYIVFRCSEDVLSMNRPSRCSWCLIMRIPPHSLMHSITASLVFNHRFLLRNLQVHMILILGLSYSMLIQFFRLFLINFNFERDTAPHRTTTATTFIKLTFVVFLMQ